MNLKGGLLADKRESHELNEYRSALGPIFFFSILRIEIISTLEMFLLWRMSGYTVTQHLDNEEKSVCLACPVLFLGLSLSSHEELIHTEWSGLREMSCWGMWWTLQRDQTSGEGPRFPERYMKTDHIYVCVCMYTHNKALTIPCRWTFRLSPCFGNCE